MLEAVAKALAIDGHELAAGELDHRGHPLLEAAFEGLGVQAAKDIAEGVVGGDAMGQVQEGPQPGELGPAILWHCGPAVGPGHHREQGDGEAIDQPVAAIGASGVEHCFIKGEGNLRGRLGVHAKAPFQSQGSSVSSAKLRNR